MTYKTKITKVGNSSAIIIPKELMERMNLRQGDDLFLDAMNQKLTISPCDPEFLNDMTLANDIMREDRDVLSKLAQ